MGYELFSLLGAAVSLLLVACYRWLTRPYDAWQQRGLQGPSPVPVFGSWWGAWSRRQGEEDLRRVHRYGPVYGEFAGRRPVLVTTDPAVARAVLRDSAKHFRSRRAFCVRDKFLHQGLLALEAHESNDSQVFPVLTTESIRKVLPRVLNCVNDLTSAVKIAGEGSDGKVIISGIVSDFLSKILVNSVLGQDEAAAKGIDINQFSTHLNQAFVNDNADSPLAAIPFLYPSLVPLDKFVLRPKSTKYLTQLLVHAVQEKINADKIKDQERHPDLLDILLELQQATKKKDPQEEKSEENILQTKELVIVQSLAVLLNTALLARSLTTLSVAILATKPELQERLHEDLDEKLPATDDYDTICNSKLLDLYCSEVLRLYPIEYRLERECCDSVELEKVKIESGMIVSIPIYALHRQVQFYEKPEDFNPERFSNDKNEVQIDPFAYLPYGQNGDLSGNNSIQWNMMVSKVAISALIKQFKFSPAEGTQLPPVFEPGVTGVPVLSPILVNAVSRN